MKILFDASVIRPPLTGIGRYGFELAQGLQRHQDIEKVYFYGSDYGKISDSMEPPAGSRFEQLVDILRKSQHLPLRSLWRALYQSVNKTLTNIRMKTLQLKIDLVHTPNYILQHRNIPGIATIHDFSYIHYPQFHPPERVKYLTENLPKTITNAAHLITDSEFIRAELIQLFSVNPEKVTAVPLGIDKNFKPRPENEILETLNKYQLRYGKYLLTVATLEPRKNLINLLSAFSLLPQHLQQEYPLVLAGAQGWLSKEIDQKIEKMKRQGLLKHLGYLNEQELYAVYSAAGGFAFPSFYEGFGFPVLEAMASGVPVLTSNTSSLAEISKGAALLAEPANVDAIAQGLEKLLSDDLYRRQAAERGLQVAAGYTWGNCIEQTVEIYKKVAAEHN